MSQKQAKKFRKETKKFWSDSLWPNIWKQPFKERFKIAWKVLFKPGRKKEKEQS
jgi:hypothetical protein